MAREDAARRLNGDYVSRRTGPGSNSTTSGIGSLATLRRSISLKWDNKAKPRPRSQSLSARSIRELGISEPVPLPPSPTPERDSVNNHRKEEEEPSRGIYLGDLSVDFGGRYAVGIVPSLPVPLSPKSNTSEASLYPASTAQTSSSGSTSPTLPLPQYGKPLHPAFNSELSLDTPSTDSLGFSPPLGTPASLPLNSEEQVVDFTKVSGPTAGNGQKIDIGAGKQFGSLRQRCQAGAAAIEDSYESDGSHGAVLTPQTERTKYPCGSLVADNSSSAQSPMPRPTLRTSKSMSTFRLSTPTTDTTTSTSTTSKGSRGFLASSLSMKFRLSPSSPRDKVQEHPNKSTERKRPQTTFATGQFCSPPDAIDPLPCSDSPRDALQAETDESPIRKPTPSPASHRLRPNRSSPFLTASASLRQLFTKTKSSTTSQTAKPSIARSLTQVFDSHLNANIDVAQSSEPRPPERPEKSRLRQASESPGDANEDPTARQYSLKARIFSPLEADPSSDRSKEQKWRERVLGEALTVSIGSGLNLLATAGDGSSDLPSNSMTDAMHGVSQMGHGSEDSCGGLASSASKSRLAVPRDLLASPIIEESPSQLASPIPEPLPFTKSDQSTHATAGLWSSISQGDKSGILSGRGRLLGQVANQESMGSISV